MVTMERAALVVNHIAAAAAFVAFAIWIIS